jgi:hypothetical protein
MPRTSSSSVSLHAAGDGDRVGQIELALGIAIVDLLEHRQRDAAIEGHGAGVAQRNGALGLFRVLVLDNGDELAVLHHQASVAVRIGRPEAEHCDRRLAADCVGEPLERRGGDQRCVAEHDHHGAGRARHRRAGGEHRVRGSASLRLDEHLGARARSAHHRGDGLVPRPYHCRNRAPGLRHRRQHVGDQRAAAHRVQHLGQRGAHARALARRQNDRQAHVHDLIESPEPCRLAAML